MKDWQYKQLLVAILDLRSANEAGFTAHERR
jgi:hypothetical protein